MSSPKKQPTVYLPHGGGPCFFMDWNPPDVWDELQQHLEGIGDTLPARPSAIIVISAHWEESDIVITSGSAPGLIYDYYGFPKQTYELTYPAPGAPALAKRAAELLVADGHPVRLDDAQGWDHGVFIPFKLMFPDADIPVISISLRKGLDPDMHLSIGESLASLPDENILIVGSGMSYHNPQQQNAPGSDAFDDWLNSTLALPSTDRRCALAEWTKAPGARASHPREEHLIPLMVCVGAAGDGTAVRTFNRRVMGSLVSSFHLGGQQ